MTIATRKRAAPRKRAYVRNGVAPRKRGAAAVLVLWLVAVALYLVPLYAGLAAWVVLGEPLSWHHLGGGALILPGVLLVTRAQVATTRTGGELS